MTIKINEEVISKLRSEGFYPDEMFSMLFALKAIGEKKVELLNKYDDYNASKRAVIIYQTLYRKELIEKDAEDSSVYFKLSEKGTDLLDLLNALTAEPNVTIANAEKEKPEKITCSEWIEEWLKLFPIKSGNRLLRGDKKSCETKMNTFLKTYKYDQETILAATKSYLLNQSADGFKFTKNAVYFINKQGEGSALAAWCKLAVDKKDSGGKIDDGTHVQLTKNAN